MRRALVLGGGGIVGVAWETALLAGLMEGGVDLRAADLIVGTSAGSIVGSQIASGRDPRDMTREGRERPAPPAGDKPDVSSIAAVFTAWASFDEMTPANCAHVGKLALEAKTMPEEELLARSERNEGGAWPASPLLIVAVDCESGEMRAFDAASGVPMQRAISASCSVPGMFPPVTIEGRRYTDGGLRSGTSADLAERIAPDVVLIVAPMGSSTESAFGRLMARQIAAETAGLEAAGAKVAVIQFDDAAKRSATSLMDPAAAAPAAAAAEAHGRRIADEIGAFWSGASTRRP